MEGRKMGGEEREEEKGEDWEKVEGKGGGEKRREGGDGKSKEGEGEERKEKRGQKKRRWGREGVGSFPGLFLILRPAGQCTLIQTSTCGCIHEPRTRDVHTCGHTHPHTCFKVYSCVCLCVHIYEKRLGMLIHTWE